MDPLAIEYVPSSEIEVRVNQQYPLNMEIPIIEDAESPTEIPAETQGEIAIETKPTQLI